LAVAVITELRGHVSRRTGATDHELALLDTLASGDELRLAAGASAQIVITAGRQRVYALAGPGRCRLRDGQFIALQPAAAIAERDLIGDWRKVRLHPGMVGRASVALRGDAAEQLAIRTPVGGQRAATLDALQWDAPRGAAPERWTYAVSLIDEQGRKRYAGRTAALSLALPRDLAWMRDQAYVWTVDASSEGGRHAGGVAEFRLVGAGIERQVAAAEAAAAVARARAPSHAVPPEEVLFAMLLDQAGLHGEADRQWRRLAQADPAFAPWGERSR